MLLSVAQPLQMTDLRISEVSGVDRAANLAQGWLMLKSVDSDVALTLARAEAVAKGLDPNSITKGNDMPALTDEARAELSEDAQEYIKSLETVIEEAATTEPEPAPTEAEALAKALDSMPEPLRHAFEKSQRDAAEATEALRGLANERAEAQFSSVAKSLDKLPESTPTTLAKALRDVAEKAPDAYEPLLKVLKAANATVAQSPLFKEFGSGASADTTSDDPATVLAGEANELMAKDSNLSFAAAMTKAANAHPDLYAQHRAANKQ